jgi:Ca2+-binding RTX toxin-like protein
MTVTTDPLDALLALRDGQATARWNFVDAVGSPVDAPGGLGNAVALSYGFLTAAPAYFATRGFAAFGAAEQAATRDALAAVSSVARVGFTEVGGVGQLTFGMNAQASGGSGYAYSPSFGYTSTDGTITAVRASELAGDVWLDSGRAWADADFDRGGHGHGTLLHEVLHALGLKHPFEATPAGHTLDPAHDNKAWTVMSYTPHPHGWLRTVTGDGRSFTATYRAIEPETPMPYDILALQALYGASAAVRTGDDVYTFDPARPFIRTIVDAGGTDTLSVANFDRGCTIDLRDGRFSSITIPSDPLPPGYAETRPGIYDGTDNLAIAFGTRIENATGGAGADQLIGNALANVLDGRGGNDTMSGGGGNDTASYRFAASAVQVNLGAEGPQATGGSGSDMLRSIENLIGSAHADRLTGNAGANRIDGGAGADTMVGGDGSDTYVVGDAGDRVVEADAGGVDWVHSTLASTTLGANVENGRILATGRASMTGNALANVIQAGAGADTLDGGSGIDTLSYAPAGAGVSVSLAIAVAQATGGSGSDTIAGFEWLVGSAQADRLSGDGRANRLLGGAGADALSGGGGNDTLLGGVGRDSLLGGSGSDRFAWSAVAETSPQAAGRDLVADFVPGEDRLDLSGIDADGALAGDQAFTQLLAAGAGFTAAGQLRFASGVLWGNTDADAGAEFSIALSRVGALALGDFVL